MFSTEIHEHDPASIQYRLHVYPEWRRRVASVVLFQVPGPRHGRPSPYNCERIDQWAIDLAPPFRAAHLGEVVELLAESVVQRRLPGI